MDLPIVYEDEDLIVINKPPGIVVNRAESVKGETVQDWVEKRLGDGEIGRWGEIFSDQSSEFVSRAGIVHRIDKETSGILLIAKNPKSFVELQRQFKEREIHKTYQAIAHGKLELVDGEIKAPVGRLPWNRERFGIVPGGKEAVTRYKVLSSWQHKSSVHNKENLNLSLLELYPETGRTHQIRVHLKYINHPILGDYLYAGRKTSRDDRTWAQRVMLHAYKIQFKHPTIGTMLALEAPIPDDMSKIIK